MKSLFCLLTFFFSISSPAWGPTGHRAVGEIAQKHLHKKTIKALQSILGDESLAEASNWADSIKSNPAHDFRKPWHYTSVKDKESYSFLPSKTKKDVVTSINQHISILKDKKKSRKDKVIALKFLIHLVGDIHQPLHVGRSKDRGGNSIKVLFFNQETNLHRVWDEGIIDHSQLSFSELARFVDRPSLFKKKWLQGNLKTYAKKWADEAVALRGAVYNFKNEFIVPFSKEHLTLPSKNILKTPHLSWQYKTRNWDVIKVQIHKAGRRLAHTLNQIFAYK